MTPEEAVLLLKQEERRLRILEARNDETAFYRFVMRPDGKIPEVPAHMLAWQEHYERWRDSQYNIGWISPPDTGKTLWMIAKVLWWLGKDPNERIAIVCQKLSSAWGRLRTIAHYIEESPELHDVFPKLRRPKGVDDDRWTRDKIEVERSIKANEATVEAHGFRTQVSGAHFTRLVFDDPTDSDDSSPAVRRENIAKYDEMWQDRLVPHGKMYLFIQRRWAREDMISQRMKDDQWRILVQGISDDLNSIEQPPSHLEESNIYTAVDLACDVKQLHPVPAFLEHKRPEWESKKRNNPAVFGATWQQKTKQESDRVFDDDCLSKTFNYGLDCRKVQRDAKDGHWPVIITSDFSKRNRKGSVVMVSGYHPASRRKFILDVKVGAWGAGKAIAKIMCDTHMEWNSQGIYIEDMALQAEPFLDWVEDLLPPLTNMVKGVMSHKKMHAELGLPGMATEMSEGQWCIPLGQTSDEDRRSAMASDDSWLRLIHEFSEYPGSTDDVIMAAWMAQKVFRSNPQYKSFSVPYQPTATPGNIPAKRSFSAGRAVVAAGGFRTRPGFGDSGQMFGFRR